MSELEEKLGQVLANPQMMQQIMSLAQTLGKNTQDKAPEPEKQMPDVSMIQNLAGLVGSTGVDPNQKALLRALTPYVSRDRVHKLERAMEAARMAQLASGLLGRR